MHYYSSQRPVIKTLSGGFFSWL